MPMDASSLHCPNCGAAVAPDARSCPYCQARLGTVSCPQCFALMFQGAAFCPKCGARRARTEAETAGSRCPGCRAVLQHVSIGSAAVLECPKCDAVWLDAADFERVCADGESQSAVLHRWTRESGTPATGPVRYRPCVRCQKMMNRVNFGRTSGAIVDVCRGHGTFLDSGELHAIVTFIQGGGLTRMREREIEDLREERRRLAEQQARSTPDTTSRAQTGWAAWDTVSLADLIEKLKE